MELAKDTGTALEAEAEDEEVVDEGIDEPPPELSLQAALLAPAAEGAAIPLVMAAAAANLAARIR